MVESAAVLNGIIRVGDTVAVAVRDGNNAALRIGEVVAFERHSPQYGTGGETLRVKLRVTFSSSSWQAPGKVIGVERLDRIAKLVVM